MEYLSNGTFSNQSDFPHEHQLVTMNRSLENQNLTAYRSTYGSAENGTQTSNYIAPLYTNDPQYLSLDQNSAMNYRQTYGSFENGTQTSNYIAPLYTNDPQYLSLNQNSAVNYCEPYGSFGNGTQATGYTHRSYGKETQFLSLNGYGYPINQNHRSYGNETQFLSLNGYGHQINQNHGTYGSFGNETQATGYTHDSLYGNDAQFLSSNRYQGNQNYETCGSYGHGHQENQLTLNGYLENPNSAVHYRQTYGSFVNDTARENDSIPGHQVLCKNSAPCEPEPVKSPISNQPVRSTENHQSAPLAITPKYSVGCDNTRMIVKTSDQASKKLCCPFCNKTVSKLARHLADVHKVEPDVEKFLSLEKRSEERREIQDQLRKDGTFNFNMNPDLNGGELMTNRRPNAKFNRKATGFKTCPYCHGFYAALRQHVTLKCKKKPVAKNEATKGQRILTTLSTSVEGRIHYKATQNLKKLFTKLRQDRIVHLIRFDWMIIVFGNQISRKHTKIFQKGLKSYRLRLAGRILEALKSIEPDVTDFASIYQPKYYDSMLEAIRIVSGFNDMNNEFGAPACASMAVTLIRQIGSLLIAEYIKLEKPDNQLKTENFMKVMNSDVGDSISKAVTETQKRMRREKTVILPTTEDVKLLSQYVESERNSCFEELTSNYSFKKWKKLAELTMVSIIIFNRRRCGETQNIRVANFEKRESIEEKTCGELFTSLKDCQKRVAQQFCRMKVRGKRDSTVHVLLKHRIVECINLLLTHRLDVGISTDNEYIFVLPSSIDGDIVFMNACRAMKKCAEECGARNPSSLIGTNLRKHMATVCMSMELTDSVVADVAKFMGHAEKVHRDYYRQNTIDREVVQISRLLEAALGNSIDEESDTDDDDETSGTISKGINGSANKEFIDNTNSNSNSELNSKKTARKRNVNRPSSSYLNDETTVKGKKKYPKNRWSPVELKALRAAFTKNFKLKTIPTSKEILEQQQKHQALKFRSWKEIKDYIRNENKTTKKK